MHGVGKLDPGRGSCSWDLQLHLHQEDSVMVGEDLVYSLILTPFINSVSCLLCQPPFWGCQSRPKLVPQEAEAAKADGDWCPQSGSCPWGASKHYSSSESSSNKVIQGFWRWCIWQIDIFPLNLDQTKRFQEEDHDGENLFLQPCLRRFQLWDHTLHLGLAMFCSQSFPVKMEVIFLGHIELYPPDAKSDAWFIESLKGQQSHSQFVPELWTSGWQCRGGKR